VLSARRSVGIADRAIVEVCHCRVAREGWSAKTTADFVGRERPRARHPYVREQARWCGPKTCWPVTVSGLVKPVYRCVPNGVRTRAAALKVRNWAFFDTFQDLSFSAETCCD
jgi:hypothetical protein